MTLLKDGHWYRSKQALALAGKLKLLGEPHTTPDGAALLILDVRGVVRQPRADGPPKLECHPPALVMQAADGHDLMQLQGRDRIARVEFALEALTDVERLVEYDHLPEARKDYSVYPKGMRLC